MIKHQLNKKRVNLKWLLFLMLFITAGIVNAQTTITGNVFNDGNNNGLKGASETGFPHVTVNAYAPGSLVPSATATTLATPTASVGNYTLSGLTPGVKYRIEFVTPSGHSDGAYNTSNSSVQFAFSGATSLDYGLFVPNKCSPDKPIRIVAGTPGNSLVPGVTTAALTSWNYNTSVTYLDRYIETPNSKDELLVNVGVPFALTAQKKPGSIKVIFTTISSPNTALTPAAPDGGDAIYIADYSGAGNTYTGKKLLTKLGNLSPAISISNVVPVGSTLNIGEYGLGGINISDDNKTLYIVNMGKGNIVKLDISGIDYPTIPGGGYTNLPYTEIAIPGGLVGCTNGTFRPSVVKFHSGQLYLTGVCDASSAGGLTTSDLRLKVLKMDPATNAFTLVLDQDLSTFQAGSLGSNMGQGPNPGWGQTKWKDAFVGCYGCSYGEVQPFPNAMDFDDMGGLIIGVANRAMFQSGNGNPIEMGYYVRTFPDGSGNFILENAGVSGPFTSTARINPIDPIGGPGSPSYGGYYDIPSNFSNDNRGPGLKYFFEQSMEVEPVGGPYLFNNGHPYLYDGGIYVQPGTKTVLVGHTDAIAIQTSGARYMDWTTGQTTSGTSLVGFKLMAITGMEAVCDMPSVEVGNRVWKDTNGNGIQDADEPALVGVSVCLYDNSNNLIATAITDANGNYIFSSETGTDTPSSKYGLTLVNDADYQLHICSLGSDPSVTGLTLTDLTIANGEVGGVNNTGETLSNNDAFDVAGTPTIKIKIGSAGQNNHTYDFGFYKSSCTKPNAGADQTACGGSCNTLTGTAPTSGIWSAQTGNPVGATLGTTTVGVASVCFANTAAGSYNFIYTVTGGCDDTLTVVVTAKPDAGANQTTCIKDAANGVTLTSTLTGTWSALAGNAGTSTITSPASSSTTVTSFSAVGNYNYVFTTANGCMDTVMVTVTPKATVGNYVWSDINNNGLNGEPTSAGINGVKVYLLNSLGNRIDSTTTANNGGNPGYYNFEICAAGNYQVEFPTTVGGNGLTTQTPTADTDNNSDANTSTGKSPIFTIDPNGTGTQVNNPTIDAGYVVTIVCVPTTSSTSVSVCNSTMPYTWNGNSYSAAGSYTVHFTNAAGCDSAATLVLTVNATSASTTNTTICSSALPYMWNGINRVAAGTYTYTTINSAGCDSVATLNLTVNAASASTTNTTICSSALPYMWNGINRVAAGTYTYTTTNSAGCDSVATLVLTTYTPGTIGNYVWNDLNGNGQQDEAASNGINGVTVELYMETAPSSGVYTLSQTTTTANNVSGDAGYYNFNVCQSANYKIKFPTNNGGSNLTTQNSNAGVDGNSDPNTSTGLTQAFAIDVLGSGVSKNNPTIDAGYNCTLPTPTCSPVTLCTGADATAMVTSAVSPAGGTIVWNTGSATTATSYTYTVTNSCGSVNCTNTITRVATPATPTCSPVTVCTGVDAYNPVMAAVSPAGGTIVWNTGNSSTATSYTYTVSNSCGSASCTNTITRTPAPTTPTCAMVTLCAGVDATASVMAAVTPAGGTIAWNTGNATTATYYTYTVTNSCGSLNCSNQIVRTPTPSSITCNPVSVCTGVDATTSVMSSVSISGGSIVWNTGNATTATSYTYTVTNSCGTASCTNTITRIATPATPTCAPVTLCSNTDATAMVNAAVSPSGGTIVWNTGNATTATSYTYTLTNACGSASCTNTITRTTAGSIGNYVWSDTSKNGLQDEPASFGINGMYVELYKETSPSVFTLVATAHTANDILGNPGYYNFPICMSGNYKVKFQTNYNGGNLTVQDPTAGLDGNSDADVITGYTPVIVIDVNGVGVAKNNNTIDAGYIPASVTGGGGGGTESKTLGDVIAVRLYGNAINSVAEVNGYSNAVKFINSGVVVNGTNNLKLIDLVPTTVANTDAAYVSTPTDLVNFTNAVEVLAIDYAKGNTTKAVAFGTKTLGDVYTHTKPICDRLKGAELLEVKNINVNGYNLMAYKVRQRTGETEYAMNLSAGTAANRNTISLQSNWFTNSYTADENLYNFQLWAVSYDMVKSMATDVISKLQANGSIYIPSATIADLPKAYISKGSRKATDLTVTVQNNTANTTGYFELKEKANELMDDAQITTRQVPFTVAANGQSTVTIPVSDNYEGSIYVYLNNKLTDLVYLADGTWSIDYNKNNTTISTFNVVNEAPNNQTSNSNEHRLLRNVEVAATTKDYVSIYKTMMGGGIEQNVAAYNSLLFNANTVGAGSVKITLIKKSITNWNDQYSYTATVNDSKDFAIALNSFKSSKFATAINANDITAINFSFITPRNTATNMTVNLSKVRFSKATVNTTTSETLNVMSVYPNPTMGRFTTTFTSDVAQALVLKVTDVVTGRVVKTQFINAAKGANKTNIVIENSQTITNGLYIVTLEGDNIKYTPVKLMMNK